MPIMRTATCCDCGKVEPALYAGPHYRCEGCTERFISRIRRMADDGMYQTQIAKVLGLTVQSVNRWCQAGGITTCGVHEPDADPVFKGVGPMPRRLQPTRHAIASASVFRLGGAS